MIGSYKLFILKTFFFFFKEAMDDILKILCIKSLSEWNFDVIINLDKEVILLCVNAFTNCQRIRLLSLPRE